MIHFWFDNYDNSRASHRLRASIPSNALNKKGIKSAIISNVSEIQKTDIVIFSKDSSIESMRSVKKLGCIVGFDICDNYFEDGSRQYLEFCEEVDFITVNSESMRELVRNITGKDSFILIDPFERTIVFPNIKNDKTIKLVWYGGKSSLNFVNWDILMSRLEESKINFHLTICSIKLNKKLRNFKNHRNISLIEWSWDIQQKLVEESDIVFIPLNFDPHSKIFKKINTKSHNRVVDGIAQGKWVISSKIPSYMPLKDFCWLDDPIDGIKFYVEHKSKIQQRIIKGQEWIKDNASPEVSAEQLKKIYLHFNDRVL